MKRHLLLSVCAFAALAMACDHASAGPNAGGTLIVHGDAGVVYTNDIDDYTGASPCLEVAPPQRRTTRRTNTSSGGSRPSSPSPPPRACSA